MRRSQTGKGVLNINRIWLIPQNAKKPIDRRTHDGKENKNGYELKISMNSLFVPLKDFFTFINSISATISLGSFICGFSRLSETRVQTQFSFDSFISISRYSISLPVQTSVAVSAFRLLLSSTKIASIAPLIPVVPDILLSGSPSPCFLK